MSFDFFFFSSRRRHTRLTCDWSSDVCSSDLNAQSRQALDASGRRGRRNALTERVDQLARGLVALAPRAEAAVDDLLEMVAAREAPHVLAPHRGGDVAAEQHRRDESDLVDVVEIGRAS